MGSAQKAERMFSQRAGLIETPIGKFSPVQRHGNHQHFGRRLSGQLGDGMPVSEPIRSPVSVSNIQCAVSAAVNTEAGTAPK